LIINRVGETEVRADELGSLRRRFDPTGFRHRPQLGFEAP
jgi:hypothetical protein